MNTANQERAEPVTAPLLARLIADKQARETGSVQPLDPQLRADLDRQMRRGIDHIARRDRNWTDVMDGFAGTVYGSRA